MLGDARMRGLCCWAVCSAAIIIVVEGGEARGQTNANATPTTGTASRASAPTLPGTLDSGVLAIPSSIVPDPLRGPSLAPAAVPGDPLASMALRHNLAGQLKDGRRERVVPVPPTLEIEVLDPNVDPLGNPAVITSKDAAGRTLVDIPPVVLVHRYYYTGDRSFQGPMLPGGPSIIVVHHPRTGDRLYVQTQMLPGAPRVFYTRSSIEYNYGPQAIILKFGHCGNPSVVYRQGTPLTEHWRQAREARHERVDRWVQRTGITQAYARVREGTSNAAGATADGLRAVGRAAVTPVVQVIRSTPLGTIFTSDPAPKPSVSKTRWSSAP
ncbi:MAG TPA: hypothetical protein VJY33_04530, partial [Isosphaeraceae bacterium]|nr:hypothetical protein [Isosphaeraceae bacterium]